MSISRPLLIRPKDRLEGSERLPALPRVNFRIGKIEKTTMATKMIGWMAALVLFGPGASAFAQEAPKADESKPAQEKPKEEKSQPPAESAITVSLRDGIHFQSADGNLDATLGGYAGIHYRFTAHRPQDNARTLPDSWFVRQLRPELSGTVYKDFDFRIVLDIPTGNGLAATPTPVTGTVQDAYIGWKYYPEASIRVGQLKEPFGQEQTTPDRYLNFDERSQGDRFVPARDIGALIYGKLFDGILGYEAGYFNGNGRGLTDSNKGKEFAGRLRFQPFATAPDDSLFKTLRFGVAGTTGTVQNAPVSSATGLDVASANLGIFFLDSTAGVFDGTRKRIGGELAWTFGPVGIRGEIWRRVDHVDVGAFDNARLEITAWNASISWLLTGEPKPIDGRVLPAQDFEPKGGGWGALELALRIDRLRIDDDVFRLGLAPQAGNANVVTATTFGVNWYVTRHIRISPNLVWEVFDDPIAFAGGRTDRHFFGGILRFQLEF